jgi:hypothetical protein
MDDESESTFLPIIVDVFHHGQASTNKEMLQIVRERNHLLTKRWLHAFIGRHFDQLQICRSLPQEDTRMLLPRAHLEEHVPLAKLVIAGQFSELVFNLDEVSSSDWDARKPKKMILPRSVRPDDVYHSVSRRYRHVTLLACIAAAGDTLTPMIISVSPIPASLWAQDLRQDEDAMLRARQLACTDENLFFEYISQVVVPYVSNLRERPEFANETAVLLMDSASPHVSEPTLQLFGLNKIMAIIFPSHMTNTIQVLD